MEDDGRRHQRAKDRTGAALPQKNLSFSGHRKSQSISRDRSKKPTDWSNHKGKNVDHRSRNNSHRREPAQIAKSDGAGAIPIANYSSPDSNERSETPRNKSDIAEKSSVVERKVTDSKKLASVCQSGITTAVADCDKNTDASKAKTDDKPKETLEDLEQFLKQLKANKQQQMLMK